MGNISDRLSEGNKDKLKKEIAKLTKSRMSHSAIVKLLEVLADIKPSRIYELITGYSTPTDKELKRIQAIIEVLLEDNDKSSEIKAFIYDVLEKSKKKEGKS